MATNFERLQEIRRLQDQLGAQINSLYNFLARELDQLQKRMEALSRTLDAQRTGKEMHKDGRNS